MQREADAVIGDAILGKVVGADFFAAIAGADLLFSGLRELGVLFFHFHLVQARAQHAHALLAIFDLRLLVLATYHGVGGQVGDAHGGVSSVDRLAARPGRAEGINADVLGFDFDVDFFGLREHGHGNGRSVHTPLLLGFGHALHAVDARLPLELREDALALDDGNNFLVSADAGLRDRHDLDLPALLRGKARVHAEDFSRKERSFVAASAGTDFED